MGEVITFEDIQERKRNNVREDRRKEEEENTPEGDEKLVLGE